MDDSRESCCHVDADLGGPNKPSGMTVNGSLPTTVPYDTKVVAFPASLEFVRPSVLSGAVL